MTVLCSFGIALALARFQVYFRKPDWILFIWGCVAGQCSIALLYIILAIPEKLTEEVHWLFHIGGQ